jgi:class 3 adenylate cyclase/tetratricopeptide (TPR) repeat protein
MTFEETLERVLEVLQREGRVSYRALRRRFDLDEEYLEDLRAEIIQAKKLAVDEDGTVLVWTGNTASASISMPTQERVPLAYTPRHLAEKILTSRAALTGERKQVTVFFCDLANSTALAERLGPEAMHTLLHHFFELALHEIHRYEGTVNQFLGDGFMALFGAPVAHEDHARRAVLAALGLQRSLHGGGSQSLPGLPLGEDLSIRMGLNTGLVVVGSIGDNLRMDYTAIGDTTNLAARLQQVAEPDTILISETTRRLVQGAIRLEALPVIQVKGKAEPVTRYKVLGLGPRRAPLAGREERTLSPFVGRERELTTLEELLAQVEGRHGQMVGVVGEAGVGKSRLLYEFRQRLAGKPVTYLEGRCLSYGSVMPYHPIIDIIRHNCGIMDTDDATLIREKVCFGLQEVGLDPEDAAPYLLQLLGLTEGTEGLTALSPEAIKARTFATLRQMSLNGSRQRTLIFEVEDLHWIDKTSEEYLASLVESLPGTAILLLCTYRPGYRPPWLEKSYATQLALHLLPPQDSHAVVASTLQRAQVPETLVQLILAKAEGNPFFLEELTRAVLERADVLAEVAVPDTIQGVLMARIDRLPEESKRLLQTAAVLGREFTLPLLSRLWEEPGTLEPRLQELKRLEFLYERSGAEEPVYVFKHALTQEVAYDSLITNQRRTLHTVAGQALEALYADRLEEAYDRLAHHYARTDEAGKAVEYLTRFAEKAARSYAHAEAVTALQEALGHIERLPAAARDHRVLDIVLRLAHSLHFLGRFQDTLELLLPQHARVVQLQEPVLAGPYYFWCAHTYNYLGDQEQAAQSAQRALEEGRRCGDDATMGKTYYVLARQGYWSGQHLSGIEHGQQAVSLLERTPERWWLGQAHWAVAINYYFMGAFTQALAAAAQAHALGEALGDPRLQSYVAWTMGLIEATRGEWEAGIAACHRSVAHSPDPLNTAVALGFLGHAYLENGDAAAATAALEQAVQHMSQFRFRQLHGWYLACLGEAYLLSGQLDQARATVLQGLEITRDCRYQHGIGWAQPALGRIAQVSGTLAEAETHYMAALQTFTSTQGRFEVGRTHLALAELAHAQGNRDAATAHAHNARALFMALKISRYVERTQQFASACGLGLSNADPLPPGQ